MLKYIIFKCWVCSPPAMLVKFRPSEICGQGRFGLTSTERQSFGEGEGEAREMRQGLQSTENSKSRTKVTRGCCSFAMVQSLLRSGQVRAPLGVIH